MSDQPLVSVLIVAYNHEKYIARAIESVLASTYRHFELIMVDDCSSDDTLAIGRKYEAMDKRVKVYLNEVNLHDYPNRNRAASYASGKYLKYVDGDDLIYPWGLEILVQCMEKFPEAGWGLCSLDQDISRLFPFQLNPRELYEYAYFGPGLFHKAPLSSIIKADVFKAMGGFTGKKHIGDFEFWHLLALQYNAVLMPHGVVWHRIHDEQLSKHLEKDPKVSFKYPLSVLHYFETNTRIPLSSGQITKVQQKTKRELYKTIAHYVIRGRFTDAWGLFKMLKDPQFNFGHH